MALHPRLDCQISLPARLLPFLVGKPKPTVLAVEPMLLQAKDKADEAKADEVKASETEATDKSSKRLCSEVEDVYAPEAKKACRDSLIAAKAREPIMYHSMQWDRYDRLAQQMVVDQFSRVGHVQRCECRWQESWKPWLRHKTTIPKLCKKKDRSRPEAPCFPPPFGMFADGCLQILAESDHWRERDSDSYFPEVRDHGYWARKTAAEKTGTDGKDALARSRTGGG